MERAPAPAWFDPTSRPMYSLHAALPVEIEKGSPRLPALVRWAFRLNEGDLLMVSVQETSPLRLQFQGYLPVVEALLQGHGHPWPMLDEMLRGPFAAVGPNGVILLPDEMAARCRPSGGSLWLVADSTGWPEGQKFTLQVETARQDSEHLYLRARYMLPVLPGFRVTLPDEALWVLGFQEGVRLSYKTFLAQVDFEPASQASSSDGFLDLEPDGGLTLPESLSRLAETWRPFDQVRLSVTRSPSPAFQIDLLTAKFTEELIDRFQVEEESDR